MNFPAFEKAYAGAMKACNAPDRLAAALAWSHFKVCELHTRVGRDLVHHFG